MEKEMELEIRHAKIMGWKPVKGLHGLCFVKKLNNSRIDIQKSFIGGGWLVLEYIAGAYDIIGEEKSLSEAVSKNS
jgi:hypothetical protein